MKRIRGCSRWALAVAFALITRPAFCLPPPAPIPPGIVAWWRGQDNTDDSINGNNGTFLGNGSYADGEVGQAFDFNGGSYVQAPDSSSLHFTNNTMSVECWIKLRTYSGVNEREIVSKFAAASLDQNVFTFGLDPATHQLFYNVASTNYPNYIQVRSTTTIPTGHWVHVAATADGATVNVYVNGVLSGTAPWTQGIFPGTMPLTIGCTMQESPTSFFNGEIDEVSLYNRALSASEIAAIYNARSAGKDLRNLAGRQSSLMEAPPASRPNSSELSVSDVDSPVAGNSQPILSISYTGGNSLLSWPAWAADFTLQATGSLTPPVAWTNVLGTLQTNGDNVQTALPTPDQQTFFRLYRP